MRAVWVSFEVVGRRCVEACADSGVPVAGIVTLPGSPDPNRSGQCTFDDVAERLGARLVETADVNSDETLTAVGELASELVFVVGWSQLVRDPFIALASEGVFGMHPTLLPRHRGRAPIPWAILRGLAKTGVTLFEIVDGTADSGPIVGQVEVPIDRQETATTLFGKVADAHVELVRTCVLQLAAGAALRIVQDVSRASVWPRRAPADGIIDWETRARHLDDWVRAQTRPYPGAFTYLGDAKVVVWRARPVPIGEGAVAGTVVERRHGGVVVACGEDGLLLEEVELAGAGLLIGTEVADGLPVGVRLG
jgi:methionyl-tRNA formyltransferase